MRLVDTRDGGARPFVAGRTVRLYVCGITPYDATHVGHAFLCTAFDVLVRYLEHLGHRVRYARNITDVDDDILRKARELGERYDVLADREVALFDRTMRVLGNRDADVAPRPSQTIPAIVIAVEGLLRNGYAYPLPDGRVYFDTRASDRFGRHARLDRAEMLRLFAERGGDPDAPAKRDPLDFLLWQPSAPDEPAWESPWGAGRPGWHIECSVMAMEHLGTTIDLHGGGLDLVFPHHEAEVVQSEHLTGQAPFARFWLNCGMVGLGGEKMSKSLGNLVLASDLVERYDPGAVRHLLLSHHYRESWNYDERELVESARRWKVWRDAAGMDGDRRDLVDAFHAAMRDDLDTAAAVRAVDEAATAGAGSTVRELAGVLGFDLNS
jgi:L-cysteine:1D-myo-inositol 2-amino-2-deoxy-alpha-D-glucopyranoside ligase